MVAFVIYTGFCDVLPSGFVTILHISLYLDVPLHIFSHADFLSVQYAQNGMGRSGPTIGVAIYKYIFGALSYDNIFSLCVRVDARMKLPEISARLQYHANTASSTRIHSKSQRFGWGTLSVLGIGTISAGQFSDHGGIVYRKGRNSLKTSSGKGRQMPRGPSRYV